MESSDWDERYSGADLVWSAGPNLWVEQVATNLSPGTALDLAGGEGRNALWLAERGWRVTLVDFSQAGLDRAAEVAAQRLGAAAAAVIGVRADLAEYEPKREGFDLVLVVYLQVPAELRGHVMRRAARAVAPGGKLLVIAHHTRNLADGFGGPQDPEVLYAAEDVVADLAGDPGTDELSVERCEEVVREVASEDGINRAIDALLLASRPAAAEEQPDPATAESVESEQGDNA